MALCDCTSKTWLSQTGMFTVTNTWYISNERDIYIICEWMLTWFICQPQVAEHNHNKRLPLATAPEQRALMAAAEGLFTPPSPMTWSHAIGDKTIRKPSALWNMP